MEEIRELQRRLRVASARLQRCLRVASALMIAVLPSGGLSHSRSAASGRPRQRKSASWRTAY